MTGKGTSARAANGADGPEATGASPSAEERYRALERRLEKVVAISDRYERMLREARRDLQQLHDLFLPICMYCKRVRTDDAYWEKIEGYFSRQAAITFSHGICPTCMDERFSPSAAPTEAAPAPAPGPAEKARPCCDGDAAGLDELSALLADPGLEGSPLLPRLRGAVERCARDVSRFRKVLAISDGYQKEFHARMERALRHDPLTGLASRAAAVAAIDEVCRGRSGAAALVEASERRPGDAAGALLLLEVAGLREVNRTCGHAAGDRLLIALARALRTCQPRPLVRARWNGSTFAVLLGPCGPAKAERAAAAALRILREVQVTHGGRIVPVRIEGGLALRGPGADARAWIAAAEDALLAARAAFRDAGAPATE